MRDQGRPAPPAGHRIFAWAWARRARRAAGHLHRRKRTARAPMHTVNLTGPISGGQLATMSGSMLAAAVEPATPPVRRAVEGTDPAALPDAAGNPRMLPLGRRRAERPLQRRGGAAAGGAQVAAGRDVRLRDDFDEWLPVEECRCSRCTCRARRAAPRSRRCRRRRRSRRRRARPAPGRASGSPLPPPPPSVDEVNDRANDPFYDVRGGARRCRGPRGRGRRTPRQPGVQHRRGLAVGEAPISRRRRPRLIDRGGVVGLVAARAVRAARRDVRRRRAGGRRRPARRRQPEAADFQHVDPEMAACAIARRRRPPEPPVSETAPPVAPRPGRRLGCR